MFSTDLNKLTAEQKEAVWARLSLEYAEKASGEVHAYISESRLNSIWEEVEKKALLLNAKVNKIVIHHMSETGVLIKTETIYK